MKKQLTKGLLFVCALAVMGMMAACGGDEMHKEAKKLAKMTVKQMNLEKETSDFTDSLQEKYGDNDSTFVEFQLIYIEELQKLDIEPDFRDYLTKTAQYLKGEINEAEYYGFDMSDFDMEDMEYMDVDPTEMSVDDVVDSVVSTLGR